MSSGSDEKSPPQRLVTVTDQAHNAVLKVAQFYGLSLRRLLGPSRTKPLVRARQNTCWICRNLFSLSYPDVGRLVGRDHSTVMSACERVSQQLRSDPIFADELDQLVRYIDPRHKILESTYKFVLNGSDILNLTQLSDTIMELACDKDIPTVEVTFRLLRGTPPSKPPVQDYFIPTR